MLTSNTISEATPLAQYQLHHVSLQTASESSLSEWRSFHGNSCADSLLDDPEWLQGYFAGQLESLTAYFLYRSERLCGVAPFIRKAWPLKWHLGELTLAQPPLRRLRLLSTKANLPEDEAAYDLLFSALAKQADSFDAIHLEGVPLDCFLWKYLHTSPLIDRLFRRYTPMPPAPHPLLRFRGSFEEYMKKFSSKHRKNLMRELRTIRDGRLGEARLVQYSTPKDVLVFLDHAVGVSQKTYQWNLHRRGLRATDVLKRRLLSAAEHGWFRSYLLFCNQSPCAFLVGLQHRQHFLVHEIGFDPALSKHSVGTVLQLMVIEDLFAHNCPDILDYGNYGTYKAMFSTESYPESTVLLFRRGPYTRFVQEGHRLCQLVTKTLSALLDKLKYKATLKKFIRKWASS